MEYVLPLDSCCQVDVRSPVIWFNFVSVANKSERNKQPKRSSQSLSIVQLRTAGQAPLTATFLPELHIAIYHLKIEFGKN